MAAPLTGRPWAQATKDFIHVYTDLYQLNFTLQSHTNH